MRPRPIYEELARCFADEGVTTLFALLGDGNMHWATAMDGLGVRLIHVRHEHNAVGAAMGHFSATGEVGVATVTCGPGFTQTITALTSAGRGRIPLVIFAGEAPLAARYYHQAMDQAPVAAFCGAHYIAAQSPDRMHQHVREAFYVARHERRPVVLGVPYDLQKGPTPDLGAYLPSSAVVPPYVPVPPNPAQVDEVAGLLAEAQRPIVLGGRGLLAANAVGETEALADRIGALLATTLPARGLFDRHPWSLGVCGGYTLPTLAPSFAEADLVLCFGTSLSYYTLNGGRIFPQARIVKVALEVEGLRHGLRSADLHVMADARLTVEALLDALEPAHETAGKGRTPELRALLEARAPDALEHQVEPGTLDPFAVARALEDVLPRDYDVVCGTGQQAFFHTTMRGYDPGRYHHMRDFGAVENGLSQAMGVAAARRDGRVVLFKGDGGLMMYAQEFETIARHGLRFLIVCANDGAYGAEIHKLRSEGLSDRNAVFGRPDFTAIARGFGIDGIRIDRLEDLGRRWSASRREPRPWSGTSRSRTGWGTRACAATSSSATACGRRSGRGGRHTAGAAPPRPDLSA